MNDVQKGIPVHQINIDEVGISNLILPIFISDRQKGTQHTVAKVEAYVDLPADVKGTHMSRLAIGVQKFIGQKLDSNIIKQIASYVRHKCEAKSSTVIFDFPYFITKNAPVSCEPGIISVNVQFKLKCSVDMDGEETSKFVMKVETPVTSLCPCSKEISEYGAHNQRSRIVVECEPKEWIWIEDIIDICENSASCEIYSVLKRSDEKYVTEKAYNSPKFVEDIVREVVFRLKNKMPNGFNWFDVKVWNLESIHLHEAYASISEEF